ncbi:hypothetical protein HOO65_100095 [Ceratocystis lukuohia]|uniref:DUF7492 domain-containing protein n=1 Tax=Ceratocystis lukuohia TaxID=2019550 RepID=A0ABR4M8U2_9PEZI
MQPPAVLATLFCFASMTLGHTWVEMLMRISSKGTMIGIPGYPRGYVARSDPGFNDKEVLYQLPTPGTNGLIPQTAPISKFSSDKYTADRPMLQASPGEFIAMRYQENGHVSLPNNSPNKPLNRGTVYVYGTSQPSDDDTLLNIHKVWNLEGTGGDKRGVLLSTRHYDDGRCHQTNSGPISTDRAAKFPKTADNLQGTDLWCQTDVQLPSNIDIGSVYTLYWVWDWPTLDPALINIQDTANGNYPTQGGSVKIPEVYLSTADVKIVSASSLTTRGDIQVMAAAASNTSPDTIGNAAIPEQLSNLFQVAVNSSSNNGSDGDKGVPTTTNPTVLPTPIKPSATFVPSTFSMTTRSRPASKPTGKKLVTVTAAPVYVTSTVTIALHTQAMSTIIRRFSLL